MHFVRNILQYSQLGQTTYASHTVNSGKPDTRNSGTEFNSSDFKSGKQFQREFTSAGRYDYYYIIHRFMTGTIYVTATIGAN